MLSDSVNQNSDNETRHFEGVVRTQRKKRASGISQLPVTVVMSGLELGAVKRGLIDCHQWADPRRTNR